MKYRWWMDPDLEQAMSTAAAVLELGDRQVILVRRLLGMSGHTTLTPEQFLALEARLDQLLAALRQTRASCALEAGAVEGTETSPE